MGLGRTGCATGSGSLHISLWTAAVTADTGVALGKILRTVACIARIRFTGDLACIVCVYKILLGKSEKSESV
jgi:hypothetical protein